MNKCINKIKMSNNKPIIVALKKEFLVYGVQHIAILYQPYQLFFKSISALKLLIT